MPYRRSRTPCVYEIAVIFLMIGTTVVILGGVWLWHEASASSADQFALATATKLRLALPTSQQNVASVSIPTAPPLPTAILPSPTTVEVPVLPTQASSPTPTWTETPLPTATSTASYTPFPTATNTLVPAVPPTATFAPLEAISGAPTPMPEFTSPDDLFNVLLLGNDARPGRPSFRTDVVVIVSVNKTTGTVNMLSLPRDLYLYVPTIGYNRINTAVYLGETYNWPGGGIELLKDTIRYNLGIPIHAYAWVNFNGFERIIDAVNGVDIVVDCSLSDYQLISPDSDPNIFANWEWTTLDIGMHHMDGPTALWFARSRVTTSDFDRNRRHQILLRAIWRSFAQQNMWSNIPELWTAFQDTVQTDLSLEQILSLAPIGIQLDTDHLESHFIGIGEVEPYRTPQGGSVLRLKPGSARLIITKFYTPPTQNLLFQESATIEIVNQSGVDQLDLVAQSRLAWEGFAPQLSSNTTGEITTNTILYDYTGVTKGSSLDVVRQVLGIRNADIRYEPDPNRTVDYRILLGESYQSCTYNPWESWDQVN